MNHPSLKKNKPYRRHLLRDGKLTAIDKRILERLQQDIYFVERPWKPMARELDISEVFLLQRLCRMKENGVIRRISATFNPARLGFASTLAAAKVAPEIVDQVAERLNGYHEITHNYRRDSEYNLWFTLVARNRRVISRVINRIRQYRDINSLIVLRAIRL